MRIGTGNLRFFGGPSRGGTHHTVKSSPETYERTLGYMAAEWTQRLPKGRPGCGYTEAATSSLWDQGTYVPLSLVRWAL